MADSRQVTMKGNPLPLEGEEVKVGSAALGLHPHRD